MNEQFNLSEKVIIGRYATTEVYLEEDKKLLEELAKR